jgi:hypothetical protein
MTVSFRDFMERLKIGGQTADELKRTFAGVFAVLNIGWTIVKDGIKFLGELFGKVTDGSGGILKITANIGDFLVGLNKTVEKGDLVGKVFDKLKKVLEDIADRLKVVVPWIKNLVDPLEKFDGTAVEKKVAGVASSLTKGFNPISELGKIVEDVWKKVISNAGEIWDKVQEIGQKISDFFHSIGDAINKNLTGINYKGILETLDVGLLSGIGLLITNFVKKLKSGEEEGGGLEGIADSLKEVFEGMTKTLSTMQNTLRAATLLEIAAAIGLLAISAMELSKVDSAGLKRSLEAMSVMFVQLFASMAVFEKGMGDASAIKIGLLAGAMILLGLAIDTLTLSVTNLSKLSWDQLAKGLTGVTVLLLALAGAMRLMPPPEGLIISGIGMRALAAAIKILAEAVKTLSGLSWTEIAKGLTGVAGLLVSLALFTKISDANKAGIMQGAGIILLATGIRILVGAVQEFGKMSWTEIGKGLTAMAGGLTLIAGALYLIPPSSVLSAAAVLIVASSLGLIGDAIKKMGQMSWTQIAKGITELAGALAIIAGALTLLPPSSLLSAAAIFVVAASLEMITKSLQQMGNMSWTQIAKSLIELAGALAIIAGAMYLMVGALPGAAALLVVAASLAILAPILKQFGEMSWSDIGKSLLMLAGVFTVFGLAGLALGPVVPVLLALGAAVVLFGVGALAAGLGVLAFSAGLTALAVAGAAGTAAIVGIVSGLIGLIPLVLQQLGLGLVAFAKVIATAGPAFLDAMVTVIEALVKAIDKTAPDVIDTLGKLLGLLLDFLVKYVPKLVDAGFKILIGFLKGIRDNIGQVVDVAVQIVVNFVNGIAANLPKIIQAAFNLIISFVNGLANAIRQNSHAMGEAGGNLASAMIEGMVSGLAGGVSKVVSEAENVAKSAFNAAKSALDINSPSKKFIELGKSANEGMAVGLSKFADMVKDPAANIGSTAMDSLKGSLTNISSVISENIDTSPTIKPVLDLTDIKNGASQINDYLPTAPISPLTPISVNSSYVSANNASIGYMANLIAAAQLADNSTVSPVTFNQYNSSPVALSNAEIYRQTKNQLSIAKGALPV